MVVVVTAKLGFFFNSYSNQWKILYVWLSSALNPPRALGATSRTYTELMVNVWVPALYTEKAAGTKLLIAIKVHHIYMYIVERHIKMCWVQSPPNSPWTADE